MPTTENYRTSTLSFKVTRKMRRLVEQMAAEWTIATDKRKTMTDVVEAGLILLAQKMKVKV